jgi:hypothetical protein
LCAILRPHSFSATGKPSRRLREPPRRLATSASSARECRRCADLLRLVLRERVRHGRPAYLIDSLGRARCARWCLRPDAAAASSRPSPTLSVDPLGGVDHARP